MLKLYNTATKQKEVFKSIKPNEVTVYSCGMTVYSFPHIGHLKAYLMSDTLVRYLRDLGYRVKQVMNVTDVGHNLNDSDDADDKMEVRAKQENLTPWDVARKYEKMFFDNLNEINISKPSIIARATENVNHMIDLIKKLEQNGYITLDTSGPYPGSCYVAITGKGVAALVDYDKYQTRIKPLYSQIDSLKRIAESSEKQAQLSEETSKSASKEARSSKIMAIISLVVSVLFGISDFIAAVLFG